MLHSFSRSLSLAARTRLGASSRTMPGQFDWLKLATTRTPGAQSALTPRTSGVPGRSVSASFSSRVCRQFQPRRALHVFPSEAALQRSHSLLWESASLRHLALLSDETTMAASSIVAAVRRVGILGPSVSAFLRLRKFAKYFQILMLLSYIYRTALRLYLELAGENRTWEISPARYTRPRAHPLIRFYTLHDRVRESVRGGARASIGHML